MQVDAAFLDHDFSEAASKIIIIDKDPLLFKYITLYLLGYEIFPLQIAAIPIQMSVDSATKNLLRDAEYFGLSMKSERSHDPRWLISENATIVNIEDVISGKVRLIWEPQQSTEQVRNVKIAGQLNTRVVILKLSDVLTNFVVPAVTAEDVLDPQLLIFARLRLKFDAIPSGNINCRSLADDPFKIVGDTQSHLDPPIEINGLLGSQQLILQYLQEYQEVPEEFNSSETIVGPTFSYSSVAHLIGRQREDLKIKRGVTRQNTAAIPPNQRGYRNDLLLFATSFYISLSYHAEEDPEISVHFEGATCVPCLSLCADAILRS